MEFALCSMALWPFCTMDANAYIGRPGAAAQGADAAELARVAESQA